MLKPLQSPLHVVLVSPRIPPNTGNVARLCAVTGCKLVLVEPLGFSIEDRWLKRAGLDYWPEVFLSLHGDWGAYLAAFPAARRFLFTARAEASLYAARFEQGDHLVFGSETTGLPEEVLQGGSGQALCVPMLPQRRSLNLSTAVGIATYEALRQIGSLG
ncbi:MAG TPA: tRNA (cytidine(34)-2'-O)-methyltransferase [Myxococcaceae bacterium]|jgi:tRNA (cytidine/uridine-2'-O-)-methyltransferase